MHTKKPAPNTDRIRAEFSGDLGPGRNSFSISAVAMLCIAFNAPVSASEVPKALSHYSHKHAVDDVAVVMRHLGVSKAHIIGCSMGSRTTLDFGLTYPRMALSLTMIGIGSGGDPRNKAAFLKDLEARARLYEQGGLAVVLKVLCNAENRV
jgi:proline iminopeptidase